MSQPVITWICQFCGRHVRKAHWHNGSPYCGACYQQVSGEWLGDRGMR